MATTAIEVISAAIADLSATSIAISRIIDRIPEPSRRDEAMLAAIAMGQPAREYLSEKLERYWRGNSLRRLAEITASPTPAAGEVIVGGGPHTAIYCAARVAAGFPKPLVLCMGMPGGVFAMSENPSFWLNSSNRPGGPGLPGSGRALNYLPGAPVQPSMISAEHWQSNVTIAFITRIMLAMYADIVTDAPVTSTEIPASGGPPVVTCKDVSGNGVDIMAGRLINATGLGEERGAEIANGKDILTFTQLMKRADTTFPLRDIGRAAIIGGGNGAMCAAEMLLGLGPQNGLSAAGLDYVPSVDIYSVSLPRICQDWRSNIRGRYQPLGGFLPDVRSGQTRESRLRVIPRRVTPVSTGSGVLAGEDTYDTVVLAQGWLASEAMTDIASSMYGTNPYGPDPVLGLKSPLSEYYAIGAAAGRSIRFSESEMTADFDADTGNMIGLFRMAGRTAALATALPDVRIPGTVRSPGDGDQYK